VEEVKQANDYGDLRWIKPRSLHLTLHFLGEQDEAALEKIISISENVAKDFHPTDVRVGEWGGFPNLSQPKIVYVSLDNADSLINLQKALADKLKAQGFEIDSRPFKTHITVARNKDSRQTLNLDPPEIGKLNWLVDSFELMKSNLLPDGAEYEVIKSFKL